MRKLISDKERSASSDGYGVGRIAGYYEGYEKGYGKADDNCSDRLKKYYDDGYAKGRGERREVFVKGYVYGYKAGQKAADEKVVENFPLDKMSKKCLKKLRVDLHPDKFECYSEIKDFYNDVQKRSE